MRLRIVEVGPGAQGPDVARLHEVLAVVGQPVGGAELGAAHFGVGTRHRVRAYQATVGLAPTGVVDAATAAQLDDDIAAHSGDVLVGGRVLVRGTEPAAGYGVAVVVGDEPIVSGTTDERGRFELRAEVGEQAPDLYVRVLGAHGETVARSATRFGARGRIRVDVVIDPAPTTAPTFFDQLVAGVVGELGAEGVRGLPELPTDELTRLAGTANLSPAALGHLADAERLRDAGDSHLPTLFALIEGTGGGPPSALAAISPDTADRVIAHAVAAGRVPANAAEALPGVLDMLRRLRPDQPEFLAEPELAYRRTDDLHGLPETHRDHLAGRLTEHLATVVAEAAGQVSPRLARAVAAVTAGLGVDRLTTATLGDVVDLVVAEAGGDPRTAAEAGALLERTADLAQRRVADLLHLKAPLQENPILADDLRRARITQAARLAGCDAATAQQVLATAPGLLVGVESELVRLRELGIVDEERGRALRRVVEYGALTDHNTVLVTRLAERDPVALAGWDARRWREELTDAPLPPGEDRDSYAGRIARNLETTYPTEALLHRVVAQTPDSRLARLWERNPRLDLRMTDLVHPEADDLDWTAVPLKQRPAVRAELRRIQRVLALADNTDDRARLLADGHDSASVIAALPESAFLAATTLPVAQARLVYAKARELALSTAHYYGAVREVFKGGFGSPEQLGPREPDPLVNDLLKIDGLAELFGSQDHCACDDCLSVLSPAAYFADLMHFTEIHVSRPVFTTRGRADHPLHLARRRPDLWTIPLTCENTKTPIPYLRIVNEVLSRYLGGVVGGDVRAHLADPTVTTSFHVPVTLPLAELRIHLGHFGLTLSGLRRALDATPESVWRGTLELSPAELSVITTPDPAGVRARLSSPASLDRFPVRRFLELTGLGREELTALLATRFLPEIAGITVTVLRPPGEIQNLPEVLTGLTDDTLDALHRLVRLWRATPFGIVELDTLLLAAKAAGLAVGGLDEAAALTIAQLIDEHHESGLDVDELAGLIDVLPTAPGFPPSAEEARLYERRFDLRRIFGTDPATGVPLPTATFHHYSLNTTDPADSRVDPTTPLLLGALGVSETELLRLLGLLRDDLPFDAAGDCVLDRAGLSLLYRHARLARALGLTIADFTAALAMLFPAGATTVTTLAQVRALREFVAWQQAGPYTVADLAFLLSGAPNGPLGDRDAVLWGRPRLDEAARRWASENPGALGIADYATATLPDLRALALFTRLCAVEDPSVVTRVLTAHAATGEFGPTELDALAGLWRLDPILLRSLTDGGPAGSVSALDRLHERARLCATLGVNGYSLPALIDDADYAAISTAATIIQGGFSAKYPDEATRTAKLEPYEDRINVVTRDALCDYLISRSGELRFASRDDIYAFFLLDVQMSGCARVSRLVSAISSVQLYLQRCTVNLERSDPRLNPGIADVAVSPAQVPAVEWGWRKNYRVWEANRKVYLYPESYLREELRPGKTPQFQALEDRLLGGKTAEDTAAEAFTEYLSGLAESANLRISGSHYDESADTYHFFGRTRTDPAVWYHRQWIGQRQWTPWELVDLPIEAPAVSALTHLGRLYLFWVTHRVKEKSTISGGSASPPVWQVEVGLAYSRLTEKGTWLPPQKLPWLYPSPAESMSAVDTLYREDALREMETSKQFAKVFPRTQDGHIVLDYYNAQLNASVSFSRRLDPFTNRLTAHPAGRRVPSAEHVAVYKAADGTAQLGVATSAFADARDFDQRLDASAATTNQPVYVTKPFPLRTFAKGRPDTEWPIHSVRGAHPESVFAFNGQQYLVQGGRPVQWLVPGVRVLPGVIATVTQAGAQPDLTRQITATSARTAGALFYRAGDVLPVSVTGMLGVERFITPQRRLVRLSTSLAEDLGRTLVEQGIDALLSLTTQRLAEKPVGIDFTRRSELAGPLEPATHVDLGGAFGTYYRELFLHAPLLVAEHLNTGGRHAEADRWYRRVFDPTAAPSSADLTPADRVWRYVGFRGLTRQSLRQLLTDQAALETYRTDPFNPHAIAALRPGAYQKAVVMAAIDNWLDWGDALFAQDTMESINEAASLYQLAASVLGPRPATLGECDTPPADQLTYAVIGPRLDRGTDFLVTLENWVLTEHVVASAVADRATPISAAVPTDTLAVLRAGRAAVVARPHAALVTEEADRARLATRWLTTPIATPGHAVDVLSQTGTVFCVPPNEVLTGYWDRVEDRLFKIRHCMNLSGVRRTLALFAPPIDPMVLVRARDAGLTLEEVTAPGTAPVPPYRFSHLIERARAITTTARSLGQALTVALENKDTERLVQLAALHERSLERETKAVKRQQVTEARSALAAVQCAHDGLTQRVGFLDELVKAGMNPEESSASSQYQAAVTVRKMAAASHLTASLLHLMPQVGSPLAMKFGGLELGNSSGRAADWSEILASIMESDAVSSSVEGAYQRRQQEWRQALTQAQSDTRQVASQVDAAKARLAIAEHDLAHHERNSELAREREEFHKGKFTGLGLYNHLAGRLTRLYREAHTVAQDLAAAAERSYRFERGDDTPFIAAGNWQADRAGLLAADALAVQLDALEKAHLLGDVREYEITQSFSIAQLAPEALVLLRERGICEFAIDEFALDLAYPGQYRRRLRAVRVTIPAIVGPHTNVGAKLSLTSSRVRSVPSTDPADLVVLPPQGIASIATSTGHHDGGVFDLNFRDERYLPFEGAGAVSDWRLELPTALRPFDYRSISDVVVHLSYTARDDGALRDQVQARLATRLRALADGPGLHRLFSLRHDFPTAATRLLRHPGAAQETTLALTPAHLPHYQRGRPMRTREVTAFLIPTDTRPIDTAGLALTVAGTPLGPWTPVPGTAARQATASIATGLLGEHQVRVSAGRLDPDLVADLWFLVRYGPE